MATILLWEHLIGDCRYPLWRDGQFFTSMPYPGFEPCTFGVVVCFPTHCTSWLALRLHMKNLCLSYLLHFKNSIDHRFRLTFENEYTILLFLFFFYFKVILFKIKDFLFKNLLNISFSLTLSVLFFSLLILIIFPKRNIAPSCT